MRTVGWCMRTGCGMAMVVTAMAALSQSSASQTQAPQQFEVASIRPDNAGPGPGTSANISEGGRVQATNATIRWVILVAFHLEDRQVLGGPAWLDNDRYDIDAKTGRPERPTPDEVQPMMQNLLAERFHLKYHRDTREMQVYALVSEGKPVAGIKQSEDGATTSMDTNGAPGNAQRLTAKGTTMTQLSNYVGNRLGRFVVDQTGLTAAYDFTLDWTQGDAGDSGLPSLVTALHDELGLKLESKKLPVDVLVIDSIDRPTQN